MKQPHIPPYACSLHFELYKTNENSYYLQIFYRTQEDQNPQAIPLPGCGKKCPFDKFYELYKDFMASDFHTECQLIPANRSKILSDFLNLFKL